MVVERYILAFIVGSRSLFFAVFIGVEKQRLDLGKTYRLAQ